jgi:DNA-binding transcriptional ArsR family regulator
METINAVDVLDALAHGRRLELFRLLVRVGPEGLPAGELGQRAGLPPASRNFHLTRLETAGLVVKRRDGRKILYAADFGRVRELATFLVAECCVEASQPCC